MKLSRATPVAVKSAIVSLLMAGVSFAQAAAVDVTALETDIKAQLGPIGTVGLAILAVVVAIAAFSWIRRGIK